MLLSWPQKGMECAVFFKTYFLIHVSIKDTKGGIKKKASEMSSVTTGADVPSHHSVSSFHFFHTA